MIKKTTFTILLTSVISLVMAQDVVKDDKSIQNESNQAPKEVSIDNKPTIIIGEPVLVTKENNQQPKTRLVRYSVVHKPAAKMQTTDNNK